MYLRARALSFNCSCTSLATLRQCYHHLSSSKKFCAFLIARSYRVFASSLCSMTRCPRAGKSGITQPAPRSSSESCRHFKSLCGSEIASDGRCITDTTNTQPCQSSSEDTERQMVLGTLGRPLRGMFVEVSVGSSRREVIIELGSYQTTPRLKLMKRIGEILSSY